MGKPSAVGQLTRPTQPFILLMVNKCVVPYNQMAAITSQWWCRLVNAYEMKAGVVHLHLQCKNALQR